MFRKVSLLRYVLVFLLAPGLSETVEAGKIPDQLKSVVSFIFLPVVDKNKKPLLLPIGTGFFVGVRLPHKPTKMNVYFVTSKHIVFN